MRKYAIIHTQARVEVATIEAKNKQTAVRFYCEEQDKPTYQYKALTANELQKFYGNK